jgi:hypothetical protein
MLALPLTTWGPVGLDHAGAAVKQADIATTIRRRRVENGMVLFLGTMPSQFSMVRQQKSFPLNQKFIANSLTINNTNGIRG